MSRCKDTNFFSEIGTFFQKSDNRALQTILTAVRAMKLTDGSLGLDTRYNARTKTSEKVLVLLLLPFFGCRHVSHAAADWVSRWLKVGYNTLYRLMRDERVDWRRVLGTLASRTLDYIAANTERGEGRPRCLVVDDTDIAKSGMRIEKIGRVFSHTEHRHIVGFKGLLMGLSDGVSFHPLDFTLHGEPGKKGDQGLTAKQRERRKSTTPAEGTPASVRHSEYTRSKVAMLIEMLRRVRVRRIDFDYLLIDSWFMCLEVMVSVLGLKGTHHVLGMLKNNVNKFEVGGESMKTGQMARHLKGDRKRCRTYHCEYIAVDTRMGGVPVRLFLCRHARQKVWKTLLTTDISLSFVKAYEIYAVRWSIEVCFKECKQCLNLEGNQSQYFNSQIAHVTVCLMQYSILALAKRMDSYETLGELFRNTNADTVEITLYEKILLALREILAEFAEYIGFPDKRIVQKFLSDNELLQKIRHSICLNPRT